jgi:hypothetical protein
MIRRRCRGRRLQKKTEPNGKPTFSIGLLFGSVFQCATKKSEAAPVVSIDQIAGMGDDGNAGD